LRGRFKNRSRFSVIKLTDYYLLENSKNHKWVCFELVFWFYYFLQGCCSPWPRSHTKQYVADRKTCPATRRSTVPRCF
jgi:hypothetical protein